MGDDAEFASLEGGKLITSLSLAWERGWPVDQANDELEMRCWLWSINRTSVVQTA